MQEYQRRLQAARTAPRRPELETIERPLGRLRSGVGRLIDGYAEGVIGEAEFEPRLAGLRRRVAELEAEATVLQGAAEQARSLHLVIGKLETFAAMVRDRLGEAAWEGHGARYHPHPRAPHRDRRPARPDHLSRRFRAK